MKLEKVSAVAEIISSVAIVVTLVYLAVQTQQNTNALIGVSRQALLQADLDDLAIGIAYPEAGFANDDASAAEYRRELRLVYRLRSREFAWFQYQSGLLDEQTWQSYLGPMTVFASGQAREFLENGYRGDPAFVAYLISWLDSESGSIR